MKRFSILHKLAAAALAGLLALSSAGCSLISDAGSSEIAYGRVAFTVPDSVELTNISLTYAADGGSAVSAGSWATASALGDVTISIPVGTYTFTLSAVYDGSTVRGTCTGTIAENTATKLTFDLVRVNQYTDGASIVSGDEGETVTKGTVQEDGSYLIIDFDASAYAPYTDSENSSVKISSTFGDITTANCTEKAASTWLQLSALSSKGATQGEIKFVVPANTSKIVVNAKNGSTSKSAPTMTIASSTSGDWSADQLVTSEAKDYTFTPSFKVTSDDDGNEITKKTIIITNTGANGYGSLNVYSIKVYAPTSWTYSTSETKVSTKTSSSENAGTYETTGSVTVDMTVTTEATSSGSSITVKKAEGWLNSMYAIFDDSASSYTIICDGNAVDSELLRHYSTYKYNTNSYADGQTTWTEATYSNVCRVDVLGLTAGEHTLSITPAGGSATTVKATVLNADRSGYAFSGDVTPGAYNKDGSLKSNASVLYVTKDNAKTVTYNGCTGLQKILDEASVKTMTTPLDIRIIGLLTLDDLDYIASSAEGLQIKNNKSPVTIEGVGHDATIWGFGIFLRNSTHVEVANLGVMCFLDDGLSFDTANYYTFVHNVDIFYGSTGGDSDQAKGDGSLDVKGKSNWQSYSYLHFWDSGKMSLCGMKSETNASRLTYHHNWFDHSDSRHPRIRTQTVHIYNNYYDGNAKYGVGVTMGASAFVEGNIFRNPHDPMMSSGQGTDATGDGTFSGETGGIIKAYNNMFFQLGCNGVKFQFMTNKDDGWTSSDNDIDCYVVDNRTDTVPSTLTAVSGGSTYNNFDTTESLYLADGSLTEPAAALTNVVKFAGRHNPDFAYTFDNTTADASYAVDTTLKSSLVSYKNTGLTKVGN